MSNTKKILVLLLSLALALTLVACGGGEEAETTEPSESTADSSVEESSEEASEEAEETTAGAPSGSIHVVVREDGSGTRDAFNEISGVAEDDTDNTVATATIQGGTDLVLSTVAGDPTAIGYISLGSLNEDVSAFQIDGAEATEENIQSGEYPIYRPFNIVYKEDQLEEHTKDFIEFIRSEDGQKLAGETDFIAAHTDTEPYSNDTELSGDINIQGSTSVTPYMEALAEAYKEVQPNVKIEITGNGSGAGITAAIEDNADIGMASREIKDEEQGQIDSEVIALDGIAVIKNNENGLESLTLDQVRGIFTGEITEWDQL